MPKKAKSPNLLIQSDADLSKEIQVFGKQYKSAHSMAHRIAVSCLSHAAEHGNPVRLNEFFNILAVNDQAALKMFIRRVSAVVGGWNGKAVLPAETMREHERRGSFLTFKEGQFLVIKNEDDPSAKTAKAKTTKLANVIVRPDGKVWKPFLERDTMAEIRKFGDTEIIRTIDTLIKKAKGESDGYDTEVSQGMLADLVAFRKKHQTADRTERKLN